MTDLILPKKLKKGDTIGVISPSAGLAPFAMHRIDKAVSFLESQGYKIKMGSSALKNSGYVSASAEERVKDIHTMFEDKEISMIICTIGGNHSNQLLKYLDFDLIRNNPKIFMGYSDITVLHYAIQSQSGLATYYGPCLLNQFGEHPDILPYTLDYFEKAAVDNSVSYEIKPSETWTDEILNWFEKKDMERPRTLIKNEGYEWLRKGNVRGRLVGGAIPSINHMAGTKYWLDVKDKILLIDIPEGDAIDCGLSISNVDAYFADLDNLGVFENIAGLIIGRPYHYSKEEHEELKKMVLSYTENKKCPTLYNVNVGHVDPIATFSYGDTIELDSEQGALRIIRE